MDGQLQQKLPPPRGKLLVARSGQRLLAPYKHDILFFFLMSNYIFNVQKHMKANAVPILPGRAARTRGLSATCRFVSYL